MAKRKAVKRNSKLVVPALPPLLFIAKNMTEVFEAFEGHEWIVKRNWRDVFLAEREKVHEFGRNDRNAYLWCKVGVAWARGEEGGLGRMEEKWLNEDFRMVVRGIYKGTVEETLFKGGRKGSGVMKLRRVVEGCTEGREIWGGEEITVPGAGDDVIGEFEDISFEWFEMYVDGRGGRRVLIL